MSSSNLPLPDAQTFAACKQVIDRSAYMTDTQDYTGLAALFTETAQLTRPGGEPLVGRDAIIESYRSRPAERLSRHLVAHSIMETLADGRVRAVSSVLLWNSTTAEPVEAFGRKAAARQVLGEYCDELVQTPEGWRIEKRVSAFLMYRE